MNSASVGKAFRRHELLPPPTAGVGKPLALPPLGFQPAAQNIVSYQLIFIKPYSICGKKNKVIIDNNT
jgi:hypothetical protein